MSNSLALPILDAALESRLRTRMDEVETALLHHVESEAGFVTQAARHLMEAGGKRFRPLLVLLAHMRTTQFIRPTLSIDILKAERVEDILPRLRAAARRGAEDTKQMAPEVAHRL